MELFKVIEAVLKKKNMKQNVLSIIFKVLFLRIASCDTSAIVGKEIVEHNMGITHRSTFKGKLAKNIGVFTCASWIRHISHFLYPLLEFLYVFFDIFNVQGKEYYLQVTLLNVTVTL